MNPDVEEMKSLLLGFRDNLQKLNHCMLNDQRYFSTNDLAALEESDLNKLHINNDIRALIERLSNNITIKGYEGDLFTKLSHYAAALTPETHAEIQELISVLHQEYKAGIQLINLNRYVINSNLNYVKELISHLTQTPLDKNNTTYDQSGVIA